MYILCGLYLGAISHADDVYTTLSTNISDCKRQIHLVQELNACRSLSLNTGV